ncbi:hypothetical protein GCM10018781_33510 [Kitasatospora indigofera]|uniref:Uncharacterized protein n=1 Tax=Kitasatospora indigofera TaxID=67307 RepID=A0A919FSK9_9ACTN|nr:hypothetical protein GCM10018781_33510 [Kitasatospora indigofera]
MDEGTAVSPAGSHHPEHPGRHLGGARHRTGSPGGSPAAGPYATRADVRAPTAAGGSNPGQLFTGPTLLPRAGCADRGREAEAGPRRTGGQARPDGHSGAHCVRRITVVWRVDRVLYRPVRRRY